MCVIEVGSFRGFEQDIDRMSLEGDGEPGAGQGPGNIDPADAMQGANDPGELSLEPSPKSAMIEVPPVPDGDVIMQGGPAAAFRTPEGGITSRGEADVNPAFLGVESNTFDPPGPLQGQKSGERSMSRMAGSP